MHGLAALLRSGARDSGRSDVHDMTGGRAFEAAGSSNRESSVGKEVKRRADLEGDIAAFILTGKRRGRLCSALPEEVGAKLGRANPATKIT
jgi:hypothetical protein